MMKNCTYTAVLMLCLAVLGAGCRSVKTPKIETPLEEQPVATADTTAIPLFPSEAIYVIGQEWAAIHDSTSAKYHTPRAEQIRQEDITMEEYLDERLQELYPESAYPGYVSKVMQLSSLLIHRAMPSSTIHSDIGDELPHGAHASESALLEQTEEERDRLILLNSIAEQAEWVSRAALDTLTIGVFEEENLAISLMLAYGPRMFYRIMQSKARAERFAKHYYGEDISSGKRGDAYKHVYVNILLRTYTNRFIAWAVMDVYWEHAHPNAPSDHFMDAHNNIVGRKTRYKQLSRTDDNSDLPSWQQWAELVHAFIEDSTQNASFHEWDKQTPSFIVVEDEKKTDESLYIYWNKGNLE